MAQAVSRVGFALKRMANVAGFGFALLCASQALTSLEGHYKPVRSLTFTPGAPSHPCLLLLFDSISSLLFLVHVSSLLSPLSPPCVPHMRLVSFCVAALLRLLTLVAEQ